MAGTSSTAREALVLPKLSLAEFLRIRRAYPGRVAASRVKACQPDQAGFLLHCSLMLVFALLVELHVDSTCLSSGCLRPEARSLRQLTGTACLL